MFFFIILSYNRLKPYLTSWALDWLSLVMCLSLSHAMFIVGGKKHHLWAKAMLFGM